MRVRFSWWVVAAIDLVLANAGYVVAFLLRFGGRLPAYNWSSYVTSVPWISATVVGVAALVGFYTIPPRSVTTLVRGAAVACLLSEVLSSGIFFWDRGFSFPRTVLVLGGILAWLFVGVGRAILARLGVPRGPRSALIVAPKAEAERLAVSMSMSGLITQVWHPERCVGSDWQSAIDATDIVVLGSSLPEHLRRRFANQAQAAGRSAALVPDAFLLGAHHAPLRQLGDVSVLLVKPFGLSPGQAVAKRILDLVLSLVLTIPAAALILAASVLILMSDGLPVLYGQDRIGKDGSSFRIWKLRTMIHDAEAATGPILARAGDPRITRVGLWLRRTHIDELPQLWNVLRGDMSLVGPRPERAAFVARYRSEVEGYDGRFAVRPGITGLAQVAGRYATTPEDKLAFDLFYVNHYSVLLDLQLLVRTLVASADDGGATPVSVRAAERQR